MHAAPVTPAPAAARPAGDDAAWIAAIRGGDRGAWNALYARHAPGVRALLCRVLGLSGDVDDAVQETFLRLARDLPQLREPAALPGFVRAIAVGVARRTLRSRARKRWLSFLAPDDLPELWTGPTDDPAWETVRLTYSILRSFPVDERVAFTLRHLHGQGLDDVAAAMGVSLATAKRRLSSAQSRFARAAADHRPLATMFPAEAA